MKSPIAGIRLSAFLLRFYFGRERGRRPTGKQPADGEMDPGPQLFLVAIPEPAMPMLVLAAILPSILRRRR